MNIAPKPLDTLIWQEFNAFYQKHFLEEWELIQKALLEPKTNLARLNGHSVWDAGAFFKKTEKLKIANIEAYFLEEALPIPKDALGLKTFYPMDLASLLPVLALNLQASDQVLDLCAAPGGKALMMTEIIANPGVLHLNEPSPNRFFRLKKIIEDYVPAEKQKSIQFFKQDGLRWGLKKCLYNKILVDAPCSGERHLLQEPQEFKKWTPERSKKLSQRQYSLLTAAWEALKPGGRLVYSTCALSPLENDEVIAKLIKKKKAQWKPLRLDWGRATAYGWQILPGLHGPWGPGYLAVLEKSSH